VLCISAETLLIAAIIHRRLLRAYPLFVAYLVSDVVSGLVMMQIPYHSLAYAAAFRVYQSIESVLQLGMAGELFQRLCWHYREYVGFGRFRFFLAAALLAFTGVLFLAVLPAPYPHLMVVWIEHWEAAVLMVTLAVSWWVLTRFLGLRPQMRSNAVAHGCILIAFYAVNAVTNSLILMSRQAIAIRALNTAMLLGTLACSAAWLLCLRRDGEKLAPEPPVPPEVLAYSRAWRRRILEYVQQAGR
jgi:hypothetical protein